MTSGIRRILPLAVLVAVLAAASMFARGAFAGDTGWTIESFRSDIVIERDGTIAVTETIEVDFANLPDRHGIFRAIPIEYDYKADGVSGKHRIYELVEYSVTDARYNGVPFLYSRNGGDVVLKIGDANKLVRGLQTYKIRYQLRGVLNAFEDHDELFWNVNGPKWPVPTKSVVATVMLAGGGLDRSACFQGPTGSDDPCTNVINDEGSAIFYASEGGFGTGEQMTIVASIGKGRISPEPTPILIDAPQNWWEKNFPPSPASVVAAVALLFAGMLGVIAVWWRHGRDRVYRTMHYLTNDPTERTRPFFARDNVVVEYTPPDDLRPAQLGLILDESADTKDVTATIVDLAVRGYLSIEEKEKAWFLGKADWRLTKLKDADATLHPFETTVFHGLFGLGSTTVDLSDLKNEFYKDLAEAQKELYADAMARKWFSRNPATGRGAALFAGAALAAAGGGLGWLIGNAGWAILGAPIILVGAVVMLASTTMSKRTAAGSEALRRTLGFRMFIETADKRRQEFNEQANIFAEYLPYAIVFGSVEKWANAFQDIDTTPSTQGWYTGTHAFSAIAFSQSMQSFSSSVSGVIASTPGSSGGSGFGGGGSSGGGGGGGGGGSW